MHGRPVRQPHTYFPTSFITGAGHSRNVSSTLAGFSSVNSSRTCSVFSRPNQMSDKCSYICRFFMMRRLTERDRVVDFEAAQDLVYVSGVSKSIPSHHHLKWLWNTDSHSPGSTDGDQSSQKTSNDVSSLRNIKLCFQHTSQCLPAQIIRARGMLGNIKPQWYNCPPG